MNVAASFRIPRQPKKLMEELGRDVDWSEEVRRFLARRVEELRPGKGAPGRWMSCGRGGGGK